ncbi:nuclear transport factor 2 family protein [Kitasatospora sp. CM 4170]|uniref:Nuclear transport factor 2 family protein n=1 Tax=Kitasatospora aburaviensis TaxID=67265 RepID=A0ABW1F467_9ACTN|nr:nuclear transport factor 2 family protein [Kitasatospora sp. CM 4170]WNM43292.1 nuclear transport factor 2 family protein [Kitasatospora sp. CM 4170]
MGTVATTAAAATPTTTAHFALTALPGDTAAVIAELRDRAEITDALHRFALGQDLRDRELFASAFAEDAELDFRPAAARWGGEPPVMTGRDTIVDTILAMFTGRVETTHQVTNPRIAVDGDTARLTALVEAQHLLSADPSTHALLKNPYTVDLVRDGRRWLIRRLRIDNTWLTGDPVAVFGG